MKKVQIGELKTNFSTIIKQVRDHGQEYLVSYGKKQEAAAVLIPVAKYKALQGNRKFGLLKHKGSFSLCDTYKISDQELLDS